MTSFFASKKLGRANLDDAYFKRFIRAIQSSNLTLVPRMLLVVMTALLVHFAAVNARAFNCSFYMAPSKVSGIGVFAGESSPLLKQYAFFREDITVPYLKEEGFNWSVKYYAFASEASGYSQMELGLGCLYNHANANADVHHFSPLRYRLILLGRICIGAMILIVLSMWFPQKKPYFVVFMESMDDKDAFMLMISILIPSVIAMLCLIALSALGASDVLAPATVKFQLLSPKLRPGQEVFNDYGKKWFAYKNMTMLPPVSSNYQLRDLQEIGVCVTNLDVHPSGITGGGKGTYANRMLVEGDVIEVAPLLVLPKHQVQGSESSLIKYCFSVEGSDLALLPITTAAMANHGGGKSNTQVEWYTWDHTVNSYKEAFLKQPDELLSLQSAELFFLYRAMRDIAAGEEVTLDYGDDYEAVVDKKGYRGAINLPKKMFPAHWLGNCAGRSCAQA